MPYILGDTTPLAPESAPALVSSPSSTSASIPSVTVAARWLASVWELPGLDLLERTHPQERLSLLHALLHPRPLSPEGLPLVLEASLGAPTAQERELLAEQLERTLSRRLHIAGLVRVRVHYRPDPLLIEAIEAVAPAHAVQAHFPARLELHITPRDTLLFLWGFRCGSLLD